MTLPDERYRAVKYAREFLRDLLDPKKTPKVPKPVRRQAYTVLKHFPGEYDMEIVAAETPEVFKADSNSETGLTRSSRTRKA